MDSAKHAAAWRAFVSDHRFESMIYVMRPRLPDPDRFQDQVRAIWDRGFLTNNGPIKQALEKALEDYLGVDQISLFCNGTLGLLLTLKALGLPPGGEVITTPFTFPATAHVLEWLGLKPVFCDIDPLRAALDPEAAAAAITNQTCALLPVHVYGYPCDVDRLTALADQHGLRLVYDAAHTFGARYRGQALAAQGDAAMISFHATKLFSTIEGGAVVTPDPALKASLDHWKNFGITGYDSVELPGLNAKMNELQAAYGLLMLEEIDDEIRERAAVSAAYREALAETPGIRLPPCLEDYDANHAYFPIRIVEEEYGINRDQVFDAMQDLNVLPRKYFHPLAPDYASYGQQRPRSADSLSVARRFSAEVLCLPIYGALGADAARRIAEILRALPAVLHAS